MQRASALAVGPLYHNLVGSFLTSQMDLRNSLPCEGDTPWLGRTRPRDGSRALPPFCFPPATLATRRSSK